MYDDVRTAGCGAVWPWILCQLKLAGGAATPRQLRHELAALELGIPLALAKWQISGTLSFGLLVEGDDGLIRAKGW